ncbi:MAG TPA: hypothetical protein VGH98_18075 [Gemmatimonadaceae bacterium]|jgi:hypothetical protein
MRYRLSIVLHVTLAATVAACAPARPRAFYERRLFGSTCFVLGAELRSVSTPYLFEALESIRPTMLHVHGRQTLPAVVLDGILTPEPSVVLHSVPLGQVRSVRRLSPTEARQRYGLVVNGASVLEINTIRSSVDRDDDEIKHCS